ncbi:TRAP transporter permease [Thermodesulfobacteriota bacterium]
MEDSIGRIKGFSYYVLLIYSALALYLAVNQCFSLRLFGFYPVGYLQYFLALYLPMVFLTTPAAKRYANRIPWFDWAAFVITCISGIYLGFYALDSLDSGWEYKAPVLPTICGIALLILSIEAVRRAGGKILFVICLFFGFYPLFAESMPSMFWGPNKALIETVWAHSMGFESLFGIVMRAIANLVPGFIVFGVAIICTGGGKFFMDFASALLGTSRGGPAKVAIVASGFFGSISGSVVSNVITTGSMTIPTMKRTGYPPYYAAAVEACASTGGCFMPPIMGAAAFLIAAIGLIVGSLSISGVGNSFSRELVIFAGGNVVLLLAMGTITSFILGMGMTVSACYIFLAVVMVPALVEIGLNPMGCHLFVMYWGMLSYLTPPVALGAITAAGIAGSHPMKTGFYSMRLGSVVFVLPYMFVFSPEMLMEGSVTAILMIVGSAFVGIWLIASAFEKWLYFVGPIGFVNRIIFGVLGILAFIPNTYTSLIGVVGAVVMFLILKITGLRRPATEPTAVTTKPFGISSPVP